MNENIKEMLLSKDMQDFELAVNILSNQGISLREIMNASNGIMGDSPYYVMSGLDGIYRTEIQWGDVIRDDETHQEYYVRSTVDWRNNVMAISDCSVNDSMRYEGTSFKRVCAMRGEFE